MSRTIVGQRGYTYAVSTTLIVWECPSEGCGIVYGIPKEFADSLHANGGSYYCPNGHRLSWRETDADRLRKKLNAAERRAESSEQAARYQREQRLRIERSNIALRGHLTRMRRRIAAGVCPVPGCKRTGFTQTVRHIRAKHPEWCAEHEEALS